MVRTTFSPNAALWLRAWRRGGVQGLADCSRDVRGTALRGGDRAVLHTPGRQGPDQPPRQRLAPSGGDEGQEHRWEHRQDWPSERRRRTWQGHLLTRRRETRTPDALPPGGEACCTPSPHGLVTNVPKGPVPAPSQSVARSGATDVVRPPSAVRRLDRSDGERGTDHERSQSTERVEHDTVEVATCIGSMGQHTRPTGCKRLRYDGVQATKTCAKVQVVMQVALAKVAGVVQGAGQSIARLTSRQR